MSREVSTDYTGRQVDIGVLQYPQPQIAGPHRVIASFGLISNEVQGIQKLVQRYLIYMTTLLGSVYNFPEEGTSFDLFEPRNNQPRSVMQLVHSFNEANLKTLTTFREHQKLNDTLPDDEQIDTAYLKSHTIQGDRLTLVIQIVSLAGSGVPVVLPLPIPNI